MDSLYKRWKGKMVYLQVINFAVVLLCFFILYMSRYLKINELIFRDLDNINYANFTKNPYRNN